MIFSFSRNVGAMASGNKKKKDIDFDMILNEMNQIKMQQLAISHEIASIQGQNQLMWAQSRDLQIQYNNQKDTVEKILGFLASVFSKKQGVGGASVPVPSEGNHFHDSNSNCIIYSNWSKEKIDYRRNFGEFHQ